MKSLKYIVCSLGLMALTFTSCGDSFLDQQPDERIEIKTVDQVIDLLVSSYSTANYGWVCELTSDNFMDNNAPHYPANPNSTQVLVRYNLSSYERMDDELFRFEQVQSSTGTDSPSSIWENTYSAIATANHALVYLDEIEADMKNNPEKFGDNMASTREKLNAARGEALLIRAYYHFILVNIFSQVYKDEEASKKDVGIPYITEPEDRVLVNYDRGTVTGTYAKIREDMEAGLKLVNNSIYERPKWHFNLNAAHAFAARFYLFTREYDKVIEHANAVLGTDYATLPSMLMDYSGFDDCTYSDDYANVWQNASLNNNIMLVATYSTQWRRSVGRRYSETSSALRDIMYHLGPNWRWYVCPTGYVAGMTFYSGNQDYGFASSKIAETFQYTDKVAGIGYAHVIRREFTCTELLLERAEAKLLKANPDIDGAVADIIAYDDSRWTFSEENKRTFFANNALTYLTRPVLENYYSRPINSNCFADWNFTQHVSSSFVVPANIVPYMNAINDMRRFELNFEGMRFFDLKRWGIEWSHVYGPDEIEYKMTWDDPRRAIEIPLEVQAAGLAASRPLVAPVPDSTYVQSLELEYKR